MTFYNNNLFSNLPCPDWMQNPLKFLKGAPPKGTSTFQSRGDQLCKFIGTKKVLNGKNVHLPQEWFGTPKWPSFLGHRGYVRSGNLDLDFEIRISDLKSNAKSENGFKR